MQKEAIPSPPSSPAQVCDGAFPHNLTKDNGLADITHVEGSLQSKCANYCTGFLPTQSLLIRKVTGSNFQIKKYVFSALHPNVSGNSTTTKDLALVLASVTSFWYRQVQYTSGVLSVAFTSEKHHLLCVRIKTYLLALSKMQNKGPNCSFLQSITQISLENFHVYCIAYMRV